MTKLIDGVILAGGASSRMGTNKSLVVFKKKLLIEHVHDRLSPQVNKVWINSNVFLEQFPKDQQFRDELLSDAGPLVGIYTGLKSAQTEWVQFCPTDTPLLPCNLVKKLFEKTKNTRSVIIVPMVNGEIEPVFSLCHKSALEGLKAFIFSKKKKITDWINQNNFETVVFDNPKEFYNINNKKDLKKIEP
ncbi:MAG: molybdenum cofactor guanylyltransferase MobA [Methylophilaceae bacterium]|nr:molybdenum cofactor guanylyltransferase MobA [Methylophilaceae bacterium]